MTDYISRELAIDLCPNVAAETLRKIPAADVAERKHGEWKTVSVECFGGGTMTEYECSLCKERQIIMSNYCPNCGARMDGANDV